MDNKLCTSLAFFYALRVVALSVFQVFLFKIPLVLVFKHMLSIFKYVYILFHPYIFPKKLKIVV